MMKKNYALVSGLILATSFAFAQNVNNNSYKEAQIELSEEVENNSSKIATKNIRSNQVKAIGDTLFLEDFANQVPAGWTVVNNAGNSNNWIWANSAPGGQYSTNTASVNSTSASNGFMSLPADLYNTPFPPGGPVGMDVYFQSPAITIPPTASVILQFEQSQRYCCAGTDELVAEVSSDGITWTTYDAALGRNANTASPNPTSAPAEVVRFNVSAQLANVTTAYVRFRQTGATHYYWMIDDVMLIEGAGNAMELEDWSVNFSDTTYNPVLTYIPSLALDPLTFDGALFNAGSNTQNGVGLEIEIVQDSTYGGLPGAGTLYLGNTLVGIPVPSLQRDTVRVGPYINTADGYLRAIFRALSTAPNQNPAAAIGEQSFIVSDSILSKDLGPYVGVAGPGNYVGGGNDGDRWGGLLSVGTNPAAGSAITCNTISIRVGNSALNDGVSIQPRIWEWNDTAAALANAIVSPPIGSSPISTVIDTSMFNRWLTLPLFPPVTNIVPGKQYVVGWEQMGGASSGLEFGASRDRNVEPFQPAFTNFIYVNDAAPGWGWVTQVAAIRMNLQLPVGVEEKESTSVFSVSPNPNDGNFAINISSTSPKTYNVNVRNMLGQTVYTDNLSVNGSKKQELSLAGMEKGVYFVTLTNGSERLVKKVIIK